MIMLDDLIPEDFLATLTGVLDSLPSMDSILADPIMLGALGGIVVFLLVLVLVKRRKGAHPDDDDDEITVSSEDDLTLKDVDELTPIHAASESREDESDVSPGGAEDLPDDVADISPIPPSTAQAEIAESMAQDSVGVEQDDILNEVDVYLAYGLYDNAEDLLNQSLEANPERADYRSKLLDTYFATKNAGKFLEQAETLKSMGTAADSYWDRVQAMGYTLAPDNALFSGGKDSDINADDFGVAKPEAADLDIGARDDITNFSTTDFNLGEDTEEPADDQNFVETLVREDSDLVEATQKLPSFEELPELDDENDTGSVDSAVSEESADEAAELEFALDGEDEASGESADDAMDFNLPDDMEGSSTDDSVAESDESTVEFNMEETLVFDGNDSADQESEEAEDDDSTNIIDMVDGFDDTTAFELDNLDNDDPSQEFGSIDQDMDDTSLDDDLDASDDEDEFEATALMSDVDQDSDDEDEFEATALMSVDDTDSDDAGDDLSFDLDAESAMDEDLDIEPVKTGTFAPGDFDDPEELVVSETDIEDVNFDDIDDLMLPDDVDEVGTKLDLARAFIDMGDAEGARSSLDEVLTEGDEDQKAEATGLLKHL
jgi:pilus assembly protein FimV